MLNYHRERFRKLTFRALALRQSECFLAYFLVCLLIYSFLKLKVRSARAAGLLVAKIVPKDFIFIFLFFLYFLFCLYLFVCLKFKPFKIILSEILPKESQKSLLM